MERRAFRVIGIAGIMAFLAAVLWFAPIYYNTKVVLFGTAMLGACSGFVGTFTVLRGRALIGDALAHAALPGLCLAFLLVGSRSLPVLLVGAAVTGILGTMLVTFLTTASRIKQDAAIGIVLSVFFGAGVALSRIIQNQVDRASAAGLDSYILGQTAGMIASDVLLIALISSVCVIAVAAFFKELELVSFDSDFARVQGWPVTILDVVLMALIAVAVVIGLPAVGVVMMAALLILPAVAARFWTEKLSTMLLLSAGFGAVTGVTGSLISASFSRMPTGPIIVVVGASLFVLSVTVAPRRGIVARVARHLRLRNRWTEQQLLRRILEKSKENVCSIGELAEQSGMTQANILRTCKRLEKRGFVSQPSPEMIQLTDVGRQESARLHHIYELWRQLLLDQPELARQAADLDLDRFETFVPRSLRTELEERLRAANRAPFAVRSESS